MTYKVELNGNDGTFLVGGNPLHTVFECDDRFIDGSLGRCGASDIEDLEWAMDEAAKDISGALYMYLETDDETAQELGYADAEAYWKASHDEKGVYRYEDPDDGYTVAVDSFWGMVDTLALTTGEAIIPHLRHVFVKALTERAA